MPDTDEADDIEKIARWLEYHAEHDKTPEQAKVLRDAAIGVRKRWWDQPVIV